MIGFQKSSMRGKNKVKRVKFTRFCRTSEKRSSLVGVEVLGCNCREGRLRRWLGFRPYLRSDSSFVNWTNGGIAGVYPLTLADGTKRLVLVGTDGYIYVESSEGAWERGAYIGKKPAFRSLRVDEKKVYYLFAASDRVFYTLDGVEFALIGEGKVCDIAIAGKRFFVAYQGGRVAYSAPFAPDRFGGESREGGELYLPADFGEVVALGGVGRYLYVFGNNAVYRVTVKADGTDFLVEPLAYEGGKIAARSAMEGGTSVSFLTEDSLCRVKGEKIERICEYLSLKPLGTSCIVGRVGGVFVLEYYERTGRSKWLAISADGEESGHLPRGGKLCDGGYFLKDEVLQQFVPGHVETNFDTTPYFQSGWERLGSYEQKILKRIILQGRGSVVVEIRSGNVTHQYTLSLQNGEGAASLCERGRAFIFRLLPSANCELESVTVEYVTA